MIRNQAKDEFGELLACVKKGSHFIVSSQTPEGGWEDFSMTPGLSNAWVTAYVGLCLRKISVHPYRFVGDLNFKQTCLYLDRLRKADGGWGYNENTRTDADSTAHTLILFQDQAVRIKDESWQRLYRFKCNDGGFSTFDSRWEGDSWGVSHPDITPVVLLALYRKVGPGCSLMKQGVNYIRKNQLSTGLWRSFWWNSDYYSTNVNVRFLEHIAAEYNKESLLHTLRNATLPNDPFDLSQILEILCEIDLDSYKSPRICNDLKKLQRDDGSWESSPILRETKPTVMNPWNSEYDSGIVVSDCNRIFTTANVIRAMGSFLINKGH